MKILILTKHALKYMIDTNDYYKACNEEIDGFLPHAKKDSTAHRELSLSKRVTLSDDDIEQIKFARSEDLAVTVEFERAKATTVMFLNLFTSNSLILEKTDSKQLVNDDLKKMVNELDYDPYK